MDYSIYVVKTKVLISSVVTMQLICSLVFAYAKSRFSHAKAHFIYRLLIQASNLQAPLAGPSITHSSASTDDYVISCTIKVMLLLTWMLCSPLLTWMCNHNSASIDMDVMQSSLDMDVQS